GSIRFRRKRQVRSVLGTRLAKQTHAVFVPLVLERSAMTYVVCEPCRDCKYTDCVVVCPTNCFYQDDEQLYIDPNECIDCEACVPECPVEAIFHETNVPGAWVNFIQLNAERVT